MSSNIVVKTEVQKIVVKNADGNDGKSAYQQAVEGGYTGTEQEFNCSLSLLADVAEGKKQIADAINYKGGEANPNEAFTELAKDIKEIPNFDQWSRLAGVLAGSSYNKNMLQGHNENVAAGSITEIIDQLGSFIRLNDYAFSHWDLLDYIEMSALISLGVNVFRYSSIKNFVGINVISIGSFAFANCNNLTNITLGTLTSMSQRIIFQDGILRNITIGQGTDIDLSLSDWLAFDVIAEGQSGIDELNSNLYNNLLTKLYDHSQDGQTRTLCIGWLAKVTQENIDYANSKGWTLTT